MCIGKLLCCLWWMTLLGADLVTAAATPCSSDETGCSCTVGNNHVYKIVCDRIDLVRVPKLTNVVSELDMFRTPLLQKTVSSESLRLATGLQIVRIVSCSLRSVDIGAFGGLYSLQTINLAYNDIKILVGGLFSELNLLQTLDLSYNSLEKLNENVFTGLSNLKTLDLSYNSLKSIPENLLKHLPSLETLNLQNTLISTSVLPEAFFSHSLLLRTLDLNDNKLTQLQPQLLAKTTSLQDLKLKGNKIRTITAECFKTLAQIANVELDDNPMFCDCQLLGYRHWIDTMAGRSWPPDKTGRCSDPPNLRGQYISNLPAYQFVCPRTTPTTSLPPSSKLASIPRVTSPGTAAETLAPTIDIASAPSSKPLEQVTEDGMSKSMERALIIGCSVGGAILFIAVNVLIVFCIRRAKKFSGTMKTKHILRPDTPDGAKETEEEYGTPYKQPTVNGTPGSGYIISNGVSGFYHTGSRSRLYETGLEQSAYDAALNVPPMLGEGTTPRYHNPSVFSIAMPPDDTCKYPGYQDHTLSSAGGPRTPNTIYTDNWQVPAKSHHIQHDKWQTPTIHRVRFKTANDLLEERTIYSVDDAYEFDIPGTDEPREVYNSTGGEPRSPYYLSNNYMDLDELTDDQGRQRFDCNEGHDIKHSTSSGDSGVTSNSPCLGLSDNMSPTLSHRHMDQHLVSIHELDQSHISINSKKVRTETYV